MSWEDYFDPPVLEAIVRALYDAHFANARNFDSGIGNTNLSYGVSAWQSSHFYLERAFGLIPGAEVYRSGSVFSISLPSCRLSFYSNSGQRAEDFRLDGDRSRTRQAIVENNQLSLFNYTMNAEALPSAVPELVVIHDGNPVDGLVAVHIGVPISSDRAQDGWLWLALAYSKGDDSGAPGSDVAPAPSQGPPSGAGFQEMPEPMVEVEDIDDEPGETPQKEAN